MLNLENRRQRELRINFDSPLLDYLAEHGHRFCGYANTNAFGLFQPL